jgi:tetratricopeptide (TPR) repeat protein
MSAKTIRNALGLLQDDPDNEKAWTSLASALTEDVGEMSAAALGELLESAREAHEARREFDAVARLLAMEVGIAKGTPSEVDLTAEQARILDEEVLDDARAVEAYLRLLELRPEDTRAEEAIEKSEAKKAKWPELVARYVEEAAKTGEAGFKSSLLVSAAEVAYRYGRPQLKEGKKNKKKLEALTEEMIARLRTSLEIDPKNRRAALLLERLQREEGEYEAVAATLEQLALESAAKEEKVAAYIRLARVFRTKLKAPERAAGAYEKVLDLSPLNTEATNALAEHFTEREQWDHLVALYEGQLSGPGTTAAPRPARDQEVGLLVQIGMTHWRMRKRSDTAEPYFERLRKFEPAHPGMLSFFRERCGETGDLERLAKILGEAQRAMADGPARSSLAAEMAQLAEVGANAAKAIDQWRALLRQEPNNKDARDALKRLYRQNAGWPALADLLRGDLERTAPADKEARLTILRELAGLHREHMKSDTALITVLGQIMTLDPTDIDTVRDLSRVYEALARWRDLLTTQMRLAELEPEASVKAELYRAVARRWLEQFSNVQNAVEAYEKLVEVEPADEEGNDKLRELYTKRRAYKPLYDLMAKEVERLGEGARRRELWVEMAKLASERLDRGAEAMALYKKVLAEDPSASSALDALEKQAERDKDFATVGDVLERRVTLTSDPQAKLTLLLKLGAIYTDRLHDHSGAMTAWKRVLDLSPGHAKALRVLRDTYISAGDFDGLTDLYAANADWEGLAEVLSSAADRATEPDAKVELSYRAADVYADKLQAPDRAHRAYERVLVVRADDRRAAAALVPLYEKDEKWARLPALYEVLYAHSGADEEKLALLHKLIDVCGQNLQDRPAAFIHARRAYQLAPDRPDALSSFEKSARASADWASFVATLEARLRSKGPDTRVLRAKIAETYATELGRVDEAIDVYRALIEENEDDDATVLTLDRILRSADRHDDLRWLFELRVTRAKTAQKIHLLNEWATLEEDVFASAEKATSIYRRILQIVPQHGTALRALARLLNSAGDSQGAAEALETDRDQREGAERAAREIELARLYMGPLKRPSDALAAATRALDVIPHDRGAIEVVEELLAVGDTRARAAVLLDGIYGASKNFARQSEVLEVMIATAAAKAERIALYSRLADVHELRLGHAAMAFSVVHRAASEFPMELDLWDRLGVLANRTHQAQAFVDAIVAAVPPTGPTNLPERVELDLAERAATLYDEMLGEMDRAKPYLERILAKDPSNERAFSRLKQILTTLERWADLEALYEQAVAAAPDDTRRTDLLTEVALVAEEITSDKAKAISYYERILAIEPGHEQAVRALDALYASEEKWEKLATLLASRLGTATLDEGISLKLRLGALHFTRLHDAPAALTYLEEVLQAEPTNRDGRDLVEKCLANPALRARAAVVLEGVYIAQDAVRDLVRVLEIRLETATDPAEQRELLRRVAEFRDERLNEGAFDVFARLVPIAPDDANARARLLEIGKKLGAHEEAARVLTESAKVAQAPQPRAEILSEVAKLYEENLSDPLRAEAVYRQVLEIDPNDAMLALPAARALERIYAAAGKSAELAQILKVEVKLEDDGDTRRELYGRLGDLSENALGDPRGAIEAWKARVEDDPTDAKALAALDRLYERTSDWRALVEVLRARERHAENDVDRRSLMARIALTLADKLSDVTEAILAYRVLLDEFGPNREMLAAMETLYEIADRWSDLAETLEMSLSLAETPETRLALLARLGQARQARLNDIPGAIEAYRQALVVDPAHGPSRTALEAMLDNVEARREAAGILRPLYEADGQQTRLLRVLDIEAEYAETVDAKLEILGQAVDVAEHALKDPARAFAYAARGLRESAPEAEFPKWLERAERLASVTDKYSELFELLRTVAPDIIDGDLQLEVILKVASLARTRLSDLIAARTYYVKALELRADDHRALESLESLYEETGDASALHDILKRRAEAAGGDEERKRILFKEARLSDETMKDHAGAIDVYEQILEIGPDDQAFAALERLYTSTERWPDLLALYERQIGNEKHAERKADLHHKVGQVLEARLDDTERAFDEFDAALKLDAQHAPTVASLERLMGVPAHASQAAETLEGVYLARLDWRRVMTTLDARLVGSEDPDERRTLLRRLAKLHEEQEENYLAALETIAKLLAEDATDEPTWAELERLARVANAEARLAEIFAGELEKITADEPATAKLAKRTGEIYESLKNVDRALHFYRRAHAFAPEEDDGSFQAIDRLLRESNRPQDRVALYRQALEYRDDPALRLTTLHTIALLEEAEIHDDDAAIETYRAALEIEDADPHALEALARLYTRRERWPDLSELTRRRAEQSALPEDEARYRLELGKILENKLGDASGAIDEYQTVVQLSPTDPSGSEAVNALEALLRAPDHKARIVEILRPIYESTDDWRHLVSVNAERLVLTNDVGEKVAILRETARLWEERGKDTNKAFDAVKQGFVLDPDDGDTRGELERLGAFGKRWDDLADAYESAITTTEGIGQRELLGALARLHDSKRDDPRSALNAWDRLFKLDETDLVPLEEMDSLATLLSDWPTLVRVLVKRAELTANDEERASTWRRVGEARRDMLEDAGGAIQAYERALELEPDSAFTLDNLIPLYEGKDDAARLVDLYRRRIELCGEDDQGLKHQLLLDSANRHEFGLGDRRAAIELLTDALTVKPADPEVMKRLDVLFTAEQMWPELLENMRQETASATDGDLKRALRKRIGALLAEELEDPRQALVAYREVLNGGYDEETATAIRELGDAREELRAEAADALEPVLRSASRFGELVTVLEMRLRAQTEPAERATTLRSIATVCEASLSDVGRAENALLQALAEEPSSPALHAEIERVAGSVGAEGFQRYADALAERAAAILDPAVTTDLYVRLGRIAEDKLKDDARAAKAYVSAGEQSGDTEVVLTALDRLFGKLGDTRALADVIERRVAVESDVAHQADLYHRLASLQISEFEQKGQGLATLRLAVERVPNHGPSRAALLKLLEDGPLFDDAFDALEGVYRALGQSEDLAGLYERRVGRAAGARDRARARLDLARVLEEQAHAPERAQRIIEASITEDPSDADALGELERLAPITDGWREAADVLASSLALAVDHPSGTRAELWVRLASWRRDKLSDPRGAEDAFVQALAADPDNGEILRSLEGLRRAPGRERELIATLRARVKLEASLETKRDLLKEAKTLAEVTVADLALAESVLRELLREDEADLWAVDDLTRLRDIAGDHAEVVTLLLRRAELETDEKKIAELKHRAAKVIAEQLADLPRAITLYQELFEGDGSDAAASTRLRELYEQAGRSRDLAKLLEVLIDNAGTVDARAAIRIDLAKLQDSLDSPSDAITTLRAILDEDPTHVAAVVALSALLEKGGHDEDLAELLTSQIERAHERGDAASELTLQVRLGDVFENRLKDTPRALATYEAVLLREPNHLGALEAVARLAESRDDWPRAATALATLLKLAVDGGPAGVALALRLAAARSRTGDEAGVESALRHALEIDPPNSAAREHLRDLYERTKNYAELATLLVSDADLLLKEHPEAGEPPVAIAAPVQAAGVRVSMRPMSMPPPVPPTAHVAEIVRLLRRAAEIHLSERKSPADAVPLLERASVLVPQDRELLLILCDAYTASHRERDAAHVLEKVIASFGAKRTKELSLYHHRLGRALASLGDKDVALAQFDLAFKIDPGSVSVLKDLGVLALETNDLDRAQKTFRALLLQRLDPTVGISKGEVFYYLGEISAKQGDKVKAVQMFERAIENEPSLDRAKAKLIELKG